ncbi:YiiD C-terminal domain-containing protein [Marinicella sediminis]|uniref:YiiD C-terminal domain-containing protein n=1 Tax=Marinicella sediminis TaxID=1792834 RepID=A0ABV7J437_9GAMM|nr:YiiD C-terminal domain-containing protein [Marinicella sediminis]
MTISVEAFQAFLYAEIPMVEYMQLKLCEINTHSIQALAPIGPNINDKQTVFGGSSSALMTICGWSLIKSQLEHHGLHNDVVIHQAKTRWHKAQTDDLNITAALSDEHDWDKLIAQLKTSRRPVKISVDCVVHNQHNEKCSSMQGGFVVLGQNT